MSVIGVVFETPMEIEDDGDKKDHKARTSIAERRKIRRVCIQEPAAQEQEQQLSRISRESEAVAGYERFHGVRVGSDMTSILVSSAGICWMGEV